MREISSPKVLNTSLDMAECLRGKNELPVIGQRYIDSVFNERQSIRTNVRKLIFSATLTHDVGKLSSLQMHFPETISIQTDTEIPDVENTGDDAIFSLPPTLQEYAVAVVNDKPLSLLHILDKYRLQDKTLIFTHSTETATRLNHLLEQFYKSINSDITTAVISSEVPLKSRRKFLSSLKSGTLNMYSLLQMNLI
jgi:ATP-dependent RNA helicase DDX51/DBP6